MPKKKPTIQEQAKEEELKSATEVIEKTKADLALLQEKKSEMLLANNKVASYIKDSVFKYRKEWWTKWLEMLNSPEKGMQKTAIIEYNKLQGRVLPTQLEGTAGNQIMVNILGMGIDAAENPEQQKAIEGEIIE
jgi:phage-related tail protein